MTKNLPCCSGVHRPFKHSIECASLRELYTRPVLHQQTVSHIEEHVRVVSGVGQEYHQPGGTAVSLGGSRIVTGDPRERSGKAECLRGSVAVALIVASIEDTGSNGVSGHKIFLRASFTGWYSRFRCVISVITVRSKLSRVQGLDPSTSGARPVQAVACTVPR